MSIIIKAGALGRAGEIISNTLKPGTAAIVSDDTVMALYGDRVEASLQDAGWAVVRYAFAPGEKSKNLETYGAILNFLAENRLTRADAVVALGGGVVGDMAGFAAATYLRGVGHVQIPTSLLACVDSSVGGKTAIDLPAGKNLLGAFYQPHVVVIDPEVLKTLPEKVFRDGSAEVAKYAAIRDAGILELLPQIRERAAEVIRRCVTIKSELVEVDERDTGIRQLLNFGHTFGHAIEKRSDYAVSHGAAVAMGMAIMARACAKKGLCSWDCANELIAAIRGLGLQTECEYSVDELFEVALSDKKRSGGTIALVVLREMGRCELHKAALDEVRTFLEAGCGK